MGAKPDSGFVRKPFFDLPEGQGIFSEKLPDGRLVHELRLEIYRKPKVIIGKGVWASYVTGDHVINITRVPETGKKYLEAAQAVANEEAAHLSEEEKEIFKIWFPTNNSYIKTWKFQLVKHSYFTTHMRIGNYISSTENLMVKFLGEGSSFNIKKVFEELGYFPGYFYDAKDMMQEVSNRFGVSIYPIFRLVNQIPTLQYFCILTGRTWDVLPHPSCNMVKIGMILYPCLYKNK